MFGEAILAVLSECLELVIPGAERRIGGDDQAAGDEPIDDVKHVVLVSIAQVCECIEQRATREYRHSVEHVTFVFIERVVRPRDGRRQRAVALGAAAAPQQPEPVVQPRRDLCGCHRTAPRRGQLDRQRNVIEPRTDLGRSAHRGVAEIKVGPRLDRPFAKERDRIVTQQRRHRDHRLTLET